MNIVYPSSLDNHNEGFKAWHAYLIELIHIIIANDAVNT